jgi:branched-chain amino acid transport system substrate-binding protein
VVKGRKGKSWFLALSIGATLTALAGCGTPASSNNNSGQSSSTSSNFLLGVGLPLTGSNANYGVECLDSVKIAVNYVNDHGGVNGHSIKIVTWDTKGDPATGVAGAQSFVSQHVNAVVGFFNSDVTVPAVRVLQQNNIPLFGGNPSTPKLVQLNLTNFIRITGDDALEGLIQAQYAYEDLHAKTAVVLNDEETFGEAFAQAFADQFKKEGGNVLSYQGIDPTANDYSSILTKVKQMNPDVLEFSGFYQPAGLLAKQAKQMGINATFVTDSAVYGDKYLGIAGKAAVGSYMTNLPVGGTTGNTLEQYLADHLQNDYKLKIDPIDANEFDAVIAVQEAAKKANSITPADLIKSMHSITFTGATGTVSFLPDGDRAQVDYTVMKITPDLKYQTVKHFQEVLH